MAKICIFTCVRPFVGEQDRIQRNAIESWLHLDPKPQIILFGSDDGVHTIAHEYNLLGVSGVQCSESGAPLLNDVFRVAQGISQTDIMMFSNSDMIYIQSLLNTIDLVDEQIKKDYLVVGRRWDVDIKSRINFSIPWWPAWVLSASNLLHGISGIDYFVFRRPAWVNIPAFAVGRPAWDNWLLGKAVEYGHSVVDATNGITAIHQNHSLNPNRDGKEADHNRRLREIGIKVTGTTNDANWEINDGKLRKRR